MSIIGINLRKIRGVKGLSQSEFANIFGLTRANIGSYEEHRADPKIDTIIKISKHYNISIDDLVKKELTVNDISNFKSYYVKSDKKVNNVRVLHISQITNYAKNKFNQEYLNNLPLVDVPFINSNSEKLLIYNDSSNTIYNSKDERFVYMLLEKIDLSLDDNFYGVIIDDNSLYKGFIYFDNNCLTIYSSFKKNNNIKFIISEDIEVWKICGKFVENIEEENWFFHKMRHLENRVKQLESDNRSK